jgi:DNA-binding CsgD family transcriptional regulator
MADDCGTARVLGRVFDCDLATLLVIEHGAVTVRSRTWSREVQSTMGGSLSPGSDEYKAVARLAVRDPTPYRWRGERNARSGGTNSVSGNYQLVIPLISEHDRQCAWVLERRKRGFTHEEEEVAGLMIPGLRLRLDYVAHSDAARVSVEMLTSRELEVLTLVASGCTALSIAHRLAISERTVHKHLEHAYAKLGCRDRVSAVLRFRAAGLPSE